jgi:hypothetical protein
MPAVSLDRTLYERLERAAEDQQSALDDLAAEAVRTYLWELDRRKISAESRWYRTHHADIYRHYAGQYVAVHGEQVVDHDADFDTLRARVRHRFGRMPVMLTAVGDTPDIIFSRRGFRTERENQ